MIRGNKKTGVELNIRRTLTRTRSAAIVVVSKRLFASDRQGSDFHFLFPTRCTLTSSSTLDSQWSSPLSSTVRTKNLCHPAKTFILDFLSQNPTESSRGRSTSRYKRYKLYEEPSPPGADLAHGCRLRKNPFTIGCHVPVSTWVRSQKS